MRAPRPRGKSVVIGSMFLLACACLCGGGAAPRASRTVSGRFMAVGPDRAALLELAEWAEEVTERLERATGRKMTATPAIESRIVLGSGAKSAGTDVDRRQFVEDGTLVQWLVFDRIAGTDWEYALEACGTMVLNRFLAESRSRGGAEAASADLPAWLCVGLSHSIDPALRARDRKVVMRRLEEGKLPPFREIVKWVVLPRGRTRGKALCTIAAAWLFSLPCAHSGFEDALSIAGRGESLTVERVAAAFGFADAAAMESAWSDRIRSERLVIVDPGLTTDDSVAAFERELFARPGECGAPMTGIGEAVPLLDLASMRGEPWMPAFATAKSAQLRALGAGRPKEFSDAVDACCAFLQALAGERAGDKRLKKLFAGAELKIAELRETVSMRKEYVGRIGLELGCGESSSANEDLERTGMQRYIDRMELSATLPEGEGSESVPGSVESAKEE